MAVRVWPARDYTRVTLEMDEPLRYSYRVLEAPARLVVDLEGVTLDSALRDLVAKVRPDDPYIASVRVGQFQAGVLRLVFDLKTDIEARVIKLDPVAQYRYRLLFDLVPLVVADPLQELLAQMQAAAPSVGTGPKDPIGDLIQRAERDPQAQAKAQSAGKAAAIKGPRPRLVTIALDPGHGGEDPGAIGPSGVREKDVVLSVARKVRTRLLDRPEVRVLLTRDGDFFVPLATRVEKARAVKADLFVSIHADAFERRSAQGASVYVLSETGASSTAARWIANKENQADAVGGVTFSHRNREVASMLMALSTAAQIKDSTVLARAVLEGLGRVGRLHKPEVERAGFAVLKSPDVPSVLVETAFISNPLEERRLSDPGYQHALAQAIERGIWSYLRHAGLRKEA
jgi:N-acetylmuramoyl-L-alanine amidase